jgi:hypothetical protein
MTQSYAWAFAILIDEFDAGTFKARRTAKSLNAQPDLMGLTGTCPPWLVRPQMPFCFGNS